jgi:hypothetical protein
VAGAVALAAGLADHRRRRRADLDRIGWVDWPTVQMLALIGLAIAVRLAAAQR